MSEYFFGLYRGHLSKKLVTAVEAKFASDDVAVVNYTEPRGEKRGWFACRNLGEPFERTTVRCSPLGKMAARPPRLLTGLG